MIACSICDDSYYCDGGTLCDCGCHNSVGDEFDDVEDDLEEDEDDED